MELIAKATGVKYRHVTYDGGNPAVVATVAGEADVTTQLAVEQADMIRGKRLRPLATVSDKPLELEGYGTIPPLSQTLPGFTAPANYFGIFIPKGVPDEVVKTLEKIWAENISKSEALKKYADEPRRAVRAVAGRGGAEGRVPGGPGQRLAAVQRRQGQGLARHGRHSEALSGAATQPDPLPMALAELDDRPGAPDARAGPARSRRATCAARSAGWCSASPCSSARSRWTGSSSRTSIRTPCPACCRALLGIAMMLLGGLLACAAGARGALRGPRARPTADDREQRCASGS